MQEKYKINGVEVKPAIQADITEIKETVFLDDEKKLLKEQKKDGSEILDNVLNESKYALTIRHKGVVLFVFGIFKLDYKGKDVAWLLPDTKSLYKKTLSSTVKKALKIGEKIHGEIISFEPKKSFIGTRWVKFIGGKIIDNIYFNNTDFYVIKYGGV